jgi:hypothetical protein
MKKLLLITQNGSWLIPMELVEKSRLLSDILFYDKELTELNIDTFSCKFELIPYLIEMLTESIDNCCKRLHINDRINLLCLCDYLDIPVFQEEIAKNISKDLNLMSLNDLKNTFDNVF